MKRHVAVLVGAATWVVCGAALAYTPPLSTPPGITLVDVASVEILGTPALLWRRLGDDAGKPLYTYDADQAGKPTCYQECAKEFTPFTPDAGSKPSGDWTIVARDDHSSQWAYQGKPLYRYSGKDPLGEPGATRGNSTTAMSDPASKFFAPKEHWRRAAYTPEKTLTMPAVVALDALAVSSGFGLVDVANHLTVYAAPASRKLPNDWHPLRASMLEHAVGDFSIVYRKDYGLRQWAYKGEALYTYAGDYAPGEVTGIFAGEKSVHAALVYQNFMPPGIQVTQSVGRGPLMTTKNGLALYYVARFIGAHGGRDGRAGGYAITYNDAKSQGARGCEGECTQSWKPMLAPANAKAAGFWEVVARSDGTKQWAFKGSPVYSFAHDSPGEIAGNNRSVILYGGSQDEVVYAYAETDPHHPAPLLGKIDMSFAVGPSEEDEGGARGNARITVAKTGANDEGAAGKPDRRAGAGFYWHTVGLFY